MGNFLNLAFIWFDIILEEVSVEYASAHPKVQFRRFGISLGGSLLACLYLQWWPHSDLFGVDHCHTLSHHAHAPCVHQELEKKIIQCDKAQCETASDSIPNVMCCTCNVIVKLI